MFNLARDITSCRPDWWWSLVIRAWTWATDPRGPSYHLHPRSHALSPICGYLYISTSRTPDPPGTQASVNPYDSGDYNIKSRQRFYDPNHCTIFVVSFYLNFLFWSELWSTQIWNLSQISLFFGGGGLSGLQIQRFLSSQTPHYQWKPLQPSLLLTFKFWLKLWIIAQLTGGEDWIHNSERLMFDVEADHDRSKRGSYITRLMALTFNRLVHVWACCLVSLVYVY